MKHNLFCPVFVGNMQRIGALDGLKLKTKIFIRLEESLSQRLNNKGEHRWDELVQSN